MHSPRSKRVDLVTIVAVWFTLSLLPTVSTFLSSTVSQSSFVARPTNLMSRLASSNNVDDDNDKETSMYNSRYNQQLHKRESMHYQIIAAEAVEPLARRMEELHPDRFTFHSTKWNKFPDGTDSIELGGFTPQNLISGENVLFLASFHNNDVTLSQFQVMICLLQSFVESLTVVLPYSPVGTMERVVSEGQVATAATYAHMFSSLPNCGKPTRLMVYDLHTLQNRFYLHGNSVASLQTAIVSCTYGNYCSGKPPYPPPLTSLLLSRTGCTATAKATHAILRRGLRCIS